MIPSDFVRACYRVLLGRDPENNDVVWEKTLLTSYESVLETFVHSPEYRRRFPAYFWDNYYEAGNPIEVHVDDVEFESMFERIRHEWSKLGQIDPYWSVITDERYRVDKLTDESLAAFFASGQRTAEMIEAFASRANVRLKDGLCIEFGCGVGRVTRWLSDRFSRVLAVDVSGGNLRICDHFMRSQGIANVSTQTVARSSDIKDLPECEFLFSTIVLQHNPPPIQYFILDTLLSRIVPGGSALFQLATHTPEYRFSIKEYLASEPEGMELHCLPMAEVFRLLSRHRLTPLEVLMDGWTGLYGSHTFFVVKSA